MKKWFYFCLTLVLALGLAACGGSETNSTSSSSTSSGSGDSGDSGDSGYTIGVALPDFDDKWLSYLQDGMKDFEAKSGEFEGIYVDAMNDASKQLSQIENFISQKVDAIAVVPVDTESAPTMVSLANDAGIPIVIVNRVFEGIEEATAYVGGNSIDAGIMQMEYVADLLGGQGNVVIMNGTLGHEASLKRTEGNKQIIEENSGIKIVAEKDADWDRAEGMTLMENWIQSGNQIDAVVSNNDEMAIGAIMALEAVNKLDGVIIAGIDGTPDALEYIENGKLTVSVFQDAFGQGSGGLEVALKAAKGEEVEKMNFIPFELITKENVDVYKEKWGVE